MTKTKENVPKVQKTTGTTNKVRKKNFLQSKEEKKENVAKVTKIIKKRQKTVKNLRKKPAKKPIHSVSLHDYSFIPVLTKFVGSKKQKDLLDKKEEARR